MIESKLARGKSLQEFNLATCRRCSNSLSKPNSMRRLLKFSTSKKISLKIWSLTMQWPACSSSNSISSIGSWLRTRIDILLYTSRLASLASLSPICLEIRNSYTEQGRWTKGKMLKTNSPVFSRMHSLLKITTTQTNRLNREIRNLSRSKKWTLWRTLNWKISV